MYVLYSGYNAGMAEPRTKVLKNGAIYDLDKGRIVSSKAVTTKITSENSAEYLSKRLEKKRDAIMRGANAVVAEGGKFDGTDLDFVEAVAEAAAIKALNPDDPKQIDAARFLLTEAGLSEQQQKQQPDAGSTVADIMRQVAAVAGALARMAEAVDVVQGDVIDTGQAAGEAAEAGQG